MGHAYPAHARIDFDVQYGLFAEFFGNERSVSVCREISKIHEESVRGTLAEVITHFTETEPKGEIVIILGGKEK